MAAKYISESLNLKEERFQVDRDLMEKLMSESTEGRSNADIFFENIMQSTQTQIEYPKSILGDMSSKQHPYIRVTGQRMDDISWAKGLIQARLNTSACKLKISISKVDHEYIMGWRNANVLRIMDATQTNIKFPDPSMIRKANHATIKGTLEQLEKARVELRLISPLVITFELPAIRTIPPSERIASYYKVKVQYEESNKPGILLVTVRGTTRKVDRIKKATQALLDYSMNRIVNVLLEVPPPQHDLIKGENCEDIVAIMKNTNTRIFFPNLDLKGSRTSQVTIRGTIDGALRARDQLIGNFPIEMTFDIPPEQENATAIFELGRREGVCITISHKERDSGMSITIKGPEKLIEKMHQIHHSIRHINNNPASVFSFEETESFSNNIWSEQNQASISPVLSDEQGWTVMENNALNKNPHPMSQSISNDIWSQQDQATPSSVCDEQDWTAMENVNTISESPIDFEEEGFCFIQPDLVHDDSFVSEHNQPDFLRDEINIRLNRELKYPQALSHNPQTSFQTSQLNVVKRYISFETVNPSPLIVGSGTSVAGKLICSGWGNIF